MTNACQWEAVDRFQSLAHYEELLASINQQVGAGRVQSVSVDPKKAWGSAWDERWFKCADSDEVWRLVAPDPPFRGIFKKVEP